MANKGYILAISNPHYYSGTTYVIYTRSTLLISKRDMSRFTKVLSQVLRGLLFIYIFITSELSSATLDYPCCFRPMQTLNKVSYTSSKHVSRQFKSMLLSSPDMCMGHRDHHNTYPAAEGVGIC